MLDFVPLVPFKSRLMENSGAKKARALFPKPMGQVVSSGTCYENALSRWSCTGCQQTHPVFSSCFTTVVVQWTFDVDI